ncbi:mitochondrial putative amino-acid acetyltransferase [Naematelia encephala]|uniref:Amino-acid acetyltransferase, mitochondrial n=1 Tax=Naematelia encephala TaxID=71784 RepID=A0A1Y2B2Q6_9TREE|nr:mitochondrial putative amino-acid acetyltransferase [Naematelia encephala]
MGVLSAALRRSASAARRRVVIPQRGNGSSGDNVQVKLIHYDVIAEKESADDDTDFILSILQAHPSTRDSRSYLTSFAPPSPSPREASTSSPSSAFPVFTVLPEPITPQTPAPKRENHLVNSLLNPIVLRPALVKIQGPFTDAQISSVVRGMAYLQKLGLVSVIVVDRDDLPDTEPSDSQAAQRQRTLVLRDVERVVQGLAKHRAVARPILATVARLGDDGEGETFVEEEGLDHIRRAVTEGEIPVLLPVALDSGCRSRRVSSNKVLVALARAMSASPATTASGASINLTPMRLLIINREGGIPSYARSGYPHLSINLASEYDYINQTFLPQWTQTHPSSLSNLALANDCLEHLPREASALIVSHRSPAALIANLITNKPAHSASLPHSLLNQSEGRISRDTPTLIRKGQPVRVLRSMDEVDKHKLTELLEKSFRRTLNQEGFYKRLEQDLDFVIVIGDYAGAAVCTLEGKSSGLAEPICYLDKFAVLPSNQGDGTVDFLWVALRDETYGLGLLDASNPSIGSLSGQGRGRDLVWRSRADNPVNKWYFERSNGFLWLPPEGADPEDRMKKGWKMFWCDAEQRLRETAQQEGREFGGGRLIRPVELEERGRLEQWAPVIGGITSAWK